ncbi:flagellar FlbD family protein [Nocardioides sp.]|uniref:flagellar FlbD family protein n=1 Tax=Nocardioides sp. TaxID=35761 RepID=UPI001A331099|nr:flagellar FlbD family protein [Nocardioides sp.]MBJ7358611.1 flagellar FlbD family protein [Nocardioides sp.]
MIRLTRLSGSPFVLNSDLIERIDTTPDTVITLADGTNYVAAESADEIIAAVRMHRAEIIALSEKLGAHVYVVGPAAADRHSLASVTELSAVPGGSEQQGLDR